MDRWIKWWMDVKAVLWISNKNQQQNTCTLVYVIIKMKIAVYSSPVGVIQCASWHLKFL